MHNGVDFCHICPLGRHFSTESHPPPVFFGQTAHTPLKISIFCPDFALRSPRKRIPAFLTAFPSPASARARTRRARPQDVPQPTSPLAAHLVPRPLFPHYLPSLLVAVETLNIPRPIAFSKCKIRDAQTASAFPLFQPRNFQTRHLKDRPPPQNFRTRLFLFGHKILQRKIFSPLRV